MRFKTSDWLGEMISGTLAGAGAGLVGALLFPGLGATPLVGAAAGAVTGLVSGLTSYPLKFLWGKTEIEDESSESSQTPVELIGQEDAGIQSIADESTSQVKNLELHRPNKEHA